MRVHTIHLIAAARPNFMKVAPLYHQLAERAWCNPVLVHTGQHYDFNMSAAFFRDLGLPEPDAHLGVGSGSHARQTAGVLTAYEDVLLDTPPDMVVVVGDVNSTMACTLAAAKLGVPVAHLEAGLRSFDRTMPEEINRVVTDALADLLWTPSPDADENLAREGVAPERIQRVGNIMMDSLEMMRPGIEKRRAWRQWELSPGGFGLVTLHRPANVDQAATLETILEALAVVAAELPLVFPVHPRTRDRLDEFGLLERAENIKGLVLAEPLGYVDFMSLVTGCRLAITDSGGIQEETTYLGIPCLTLRPNTERPITVTQGTNRLVETDELASAAREALAQPPEKARRPEMWDGRTAQRVADSLEHWLNP